MVGLRRFLPGIGPDLQYQRWYGTGTTWQLIQDAVVDLGRASDFSTTRPIRYESKMPISQSATKAIVR